MKMFSHLIIATAMIVASSMMACKTESPTGNVNLAGKTFKVSGRITSTSSYCGGAAPSPEMMESLARPRPYSQAVIWFREGTVNNLKKKAYKVVADEQGKFEVELPAGSYCVIREYQTDRSILEEYTSGSQQIVANVECLNEQWKACIRTLEVMSPLDSVNFEFHFSCFLPEGIPCLDYTGPLPP